MRRGWALGHPAATEAVTKAAQQEQEKVTPETLVVIAAAVTAFLGKKVRIRSAKLLRQQAVGASAWAQQGAPRFMARIIRDCGAGV